MKQIKKILIPFCCIVLLLGCNTSNDQVKEEKNNVTNDLEEITDSKENENDDKSDTTDESSWLSLNEEDADHSDNASLQLKVTKVDEDAGVTVDTDKNYQSLNEIIKNNPQLGTPNDFSLHPITFDGDSSQGTQTLFFLGINRIDKTIKNLNFDITLGTDQGDYVWNKMNVDVSENIIGVFEPNQAIPILLDVTEEQFEVYQSLTDENIIFELDDFTFETE